MTVIWQVDTKDGEVIIAGVGKAVTAITARLTSLSQFDGTESKVRDELEEVLWLLLQTTNFNR